MVHKRILCLLLLTVIMSLMSLIAPLAAMSCTITIDSVEATPPDVTIRGSVTPPGKCDKVKVTLTCSDQVHEESTIPVDADGKWTATFRVHCDCDDSYVVRAICLDNEDCPEAEVKGDELCPEETPCAITINSVEGTPPDPPSVTVTGTVTPPEECDNIEVTLECRGGELVSDPIPVDAGGNWTAIFEDTSSIACLCNDFYVVRVICIDNPDCPEATDKDGELCPQECPDVFVSSHVCGVDEDENDEECCVDGKRLVILSSVHSGVGPLSAEWIYGGSCPDESFTLDGGIIDTKICYYDLGTYTATLHIGGCPDESTSFTVSECPPEHECPSISIEQTSLNCKSDGHQPIMTNVTFTGIPGFTIAAELKEGANVLDSGSSDTGILVLGDTGDYASGSYTFTVDVTEPEGCSVLDWLLEVECEADGACCLTDGSCEELTEAECTSLDGDYKGDGTSCADFDCTSNGNGNGNDDDCFFCFCSPLLSWCCILYILFIIALIAAIVSLAYALCTGGTVAWGIFFTSLAVVIFLVIWLMTVCDVGICEMLLALGTGGLINWGIICGTNIIPCKSWLCQMTTIPILGIQMQNFLIINIILWILAALFCVLF